MNLYANISYEGPDGFLHIPFTNSPEVFRSGAMLCLPDSTFAVSTLHYLAGNMARYASVLGYEDDEARWARFDSCLVPVTVTENGYPLFPDVTPDECHRHFCHLFPLFPLSTDTHSGAADRSLDNVVNLGFTEYASWSFPYLAALASRCSRGNMALMMEEIYASGFRSPNSFPVNGDPYRTGLLRVSDQNAGESSDAFTLEAGFLFASALCDMFVHRSGDTVWVMAGVPDSWQEACCENIRIEGGHLMSARMENGALTGVRVLAGRDETLDFVLHRSDSAIPRTAVLRKGEICDILSLPEGSPS